MVRLSRNPSRLQNRIKELDQELSTVDRKLSSASKRKNNLAAERQAILKAMEGRVAGIALAYVMSDSERAAAFRKSLRGNESSTVSMYLDLKSAGGTVKAAKKVRKAVKKGAGRKASKKAAKAVAAPAQAA
ncbi:MAG: hypothetical protein ACLGI7_17700 [Gammaproteobacteria bacterium]